MSQNFYTSHYKSLTFLIAILLLLGANVWAQGNKIITGSIIDAGSKQTVEFATVALQDKSGKVLTGATCDALGKFQILVAPGEYNLAISFIGYQTKLQPITVPATGTALALGKIELPLDNKSLKEVQVTADRDLVEETDDGFVYNAEKDINASGGTAADILKNVPGLSVDPDGNLEMQGTTKIKVLIDNKPSSIMAGNLAEALQQIPANMIAKVEVITTPSAKYDSEGTGGVINIITKKTTTLQGYNGGVNITGGNRANAMNGYMSTRMGKFSLSGNGGYNINRGFGNGENEQVFYERSQVAQSSEYKNDGQGINGQLSSNYDFNDKNNLGATVRMRNYTSDNDRFSSSLETSTVLETFGEIKRHDRSNTDSKSLSDGLDANLDYTRKFKKKDQELNILMLYSRNEREGENYTIRRNKDEKIDNRQQSNNEAFNDELAFQVDYEHPLNKFGNIEAGTRITLRNNFSNSQYAWARTIEAPMLIDDKRTNTFDYDQDVYSSYLNYGFRLKKKYFFRFGGRYEYTNILADFVTSGTSLRKPYSSFMPNITVSMRLKENAWLSNSRISLNYSTRIFRPQIDYLNPFADSSNIRSIRIGNPDLLPELTHNVQATFSNYLKKISTNVNTSFYWRQTNDDIGQFRSFTRVKNPTALIDNDPQNDSVNSITTSWLNNGTNLTYGTNFSINSRIKKMISVGTNLSLYYNEVNGFIWSDIHKKSLPVSNSGWMYNINFNTGFRIPKTFEGPFKDVSAQFQTSLSSPRRSLQGKYSSFQRYNASFRKEFIINKSERNKNGDRASISFSIENFLNSGNQIRSTTYNERFTTTSIQNYYNRVYRVGLSYSFNKMQYKAKPEREPKNKRYDDTSKGDIGQPKEIRVPELPENNKAGNQKQNKPSIKTKPEAPAKQ